MSSASHDRDDDDGPIHREEHPTHDEEPWLVSYADMMTLLFGFFVLMYVFTLAKLDQAPKPIPPDMLLMRREVARYFGGRYATPLASVRDELVEALKELTGDGGLQVELTPEGMEITMQSSALFASGSAALNPQAAAALSGMARHVLTKPDSYAVMVEGHTDDAPIVMGVEKWPTNWELSGARASAVVRLFESAGFPAERLSTLGLGSSRPLLPNRDRSGSPIAENRAQNRRIKVVVTLAKDASSSEASGKSGMRARPD